MARYEFGGEFNALVVTADAALGGALKAAPGTTLPALYNKPVTDGTRVIVTDFLVDDGGDGLLNDAASSITVDSAGYPRRFLGPDNVNPLYDAAGHAYYSHDTGSEVPIGDETRVGLLELATSAETLTGTDNTRAVHPLALEAKVAAHDSDPTSHQDIRDQVSANTTAMLQKADLVGGVVPDDQIAASASGQPDAVVRYTATGSVVGTPALNDTELMQKIQVDAAIASSAVVGADVRWKPLVTPPAALTNDTSFQTLTDMGITDAASGQTWVVDLDLMYRAIAAGGLQIRWKLATAAVTNQLANPEFASSTANWTPTAVTAIARVTAAGPASTTHYATITALAASNSVTTSEWKPCNPSDKRSVGAYWKWITGTPKVCRADIQFGDAAGTVLSSVITGTITPGTGSFTQSTLLNVTAPSGTTQARVRLITQAPANGDVVAVGAIQLEPGATLPAYGDTGTSGPLAMDILGTWSGLTQTSADIDAYSRTKTVRYPTNASLTGGFGGVGIAAGDEVNLKGSFRITVTGTGLLDQTIVPEVAQRVTNASASTVVGGWASFARVA